MKYRLLLSISPGICKLRKINKNLLRVILSVAMLQSIDAFAVEAWTYLQANDPGTNRSYSTVRSPMPRLDLYDDLRLEVMCKENKLQVVVDSDILIASQGSSFDFEYQIDKQPSVKIQMRTFPDSKRKGYTEEQAKTIIDAMLTGQAVFIRINTMIRRVLSGSIPLNGAAEPIKHVLADCGISADSAVAESPYSLEEFEQALNKLSSEQQRQIMSKVRKLMTE